jgi:hypothetical protein
LYDFRNATLLNSIFLESDLACQGSNIFVRSPLYAGASYIPVGGHHFNIVKSRSKYPYMKVLPFS